FAYSVSHDLKAPLRAVTGFSEALLHDSGPALDVKGREYIERIVASSQRMGEMLDHLLRYSRAARSEPSFQNVDLSKLATKICMTLQAQAPKRAVTWIVEPGLTHRTDEKWLQTILELLLDNAWKFTGPTPNPRIEFGLRRQESPAYFVRDNGAGFCVAYADKLFFPFQRLHPADEFPGQGMGLAIVRRIIARLGGRIWAESEPGKGATFFFTLAG
ncbi:MAG TPA: ATP-binding protein, partial [Candidatus Saccharimonadales bacterium]|nr:ATP-binding protein [Candidatus Saccharimonadales bacterium]